MCTARPLVAILVVGLLGALGAACSATADDTESAGSGVSSSDGGVTAAAGFEGAACGSRRATKCQAGLACGDAGVCEQVARPRGDVGAKCGTVRGLRCKDGLECSVAQGDAPGVCRAQTFGDEGDRCDGPAIPVACARAFVCKKERPGDASGICTAPLDGEEGGPCGGGVTCFAPLVCHDESGGLGLGSCARP